MMGHQKLELYFRNNFALMHHHKWSLYELERMAPWEKTIYLDMLQEFLAEEERRQREHESAMRSKGRR